MSKQHLPNLALILTIPPFAMPAIAMAPIAAAIPIAMTRIIYANAQNRVDNDGRCSIGSTISGGPAVSANATTLSGVGWSNNGKGCYGRESRDQHLFDHKFLTLTYWGTYLATR